MSPTPIIIDTDPGIDDAMAILYLLGHNLVEVIGLTTVAGNTDISTVTTNALALLELAGRSDIPVAVGEGGPLAGARPRSGSSHGDDGLGNAPRPAPTQTPVAMHAVDFIAEQLESSREKVAILGIAPLTNIGLLCQRHPGLLKRIDHLVVMGTSFDGGNVTPFAEFNTWSDPEAADEVFAAGVKTTVVPFDLTRHISLTSKHLQRLPPGVIRDFVIAADGAYADAHQDDSGERATVQHDAAAAVCLTTPDIFQFVHGAVNVNCSGDLQRGQVARRPSDERQPVRVAVQHNSIAWRVELMKGLINLARSVNTHAEISQHQQHHQKLRER